MMYSNKHLVRILAGIKIGKEDLLWENACVVRESDKPHQTMDGQEQLESKTCTALHCQSGSQLSLEINPTVVMERPTASTVR